MLTLLCRVRLLLGACVYAIGGAIAIDTSSASLDMHAPHPIAVAGWANASGILPDGFAPAYLASGLWGVRVPPQALGGTVHVHGTNGDRTTPSLVGGYEHYATPVCDEYCDSVGDQLEACPAPYPFSTEVNVTVPGGGAWFSFLQGTKGAGMKTLSQNLDFATGELTSQLVFAADDNSWSVEMDVLQFISQAAPSLGMQKLTVTKRTPSSLNITLYPSITMTDIPKDSATPELNCPVVGKRDTNCPGGGWGVPGPAFVAMKSNSGHEMAAAIFTQCTNTSSLPPNAGGRRCPNAIPCGPVAPCGSLADGSQLTLYSFISVVGQAHAPRPWRLAQSQAYYSGYNGFDVGRAANRAVWADRWRGRVVPAGPGVTKRLQATLDASAYNLLTTSHKSSRAGMSIDGFSCVEYGGHQFWDVDFWMMPPLAGLNAPAAGGVMGFRGRTLDMSIKNAALYGFEGAMFPWETAMSDGSDATTGGSQWSEQHITLDVALGVWATSRALNSTAFTTDTAFPVISNVASWLVSRGTFTSRGFEILYMGGPDESLPKVNNSGFFNVGGMIVLEAAIALAARMPEGVADPLVIAKWQRALDRFWLPKTPQGVIKPFDEAPDDIAQATLENWSLGTLQYLLAQGFPMPSAIDDDTLRRTLEAEEILRHRYPASASVGCSETLGHGDASEWFICAPYATVTALLGNRTEAHAIMESFGEFYFLPPFFITTEAGTSRRHWGSYFTNFGATLATIMYGMSGVRLSALDTDPASWGKRSAALPEGWSSVSYAAWFGGRRYTVVAKQGEKAIITPLDEKGVY